jgi:hypothetical protein
LTAHCARRRRFPRIYQLEHRIEAHIFVAFLEYCLHVTLRAKLKPLAPGLTPRAVLDKLAAIQMLDVCHRSPRRASPRQWGSQRAVWPRTCSGDFRGVGIDFIHFFSPIA